MATGQLNCVIEHFRAIALRDDGAGMTDGDLLERFLSAREEAAFAALVHRHGPMVLGACRRVLDNGHDAEDAFQATFLVLVRKAESLRSRETVANWLYGVAYHTALKARAATRRRWFKESQVNAMRPRAETSQDRGHDWQPLLDQELSRLPDKYREPIVLCELEGKTRRQAARQLGVPEGTLSGRLTTARRLLAKRLTRRGVTLAAGSLVASWSPRTLLASVPAPLASSTVQAAVVWTAAPTAATGLISAQVAALAEGVLKAMLIAKLKLIALVIAVAGALGVSAGAVARGSLAQPALEAPTVAVHNAAGAGAVDDDAAAQDPAQPRQRGEVRGAATTSGKLESVDAAKLSLTVSTFSRQDNQTTEKTYAVAKDAKIQRDGKTVKLSDLKQGSNVSLILTADLKTAVGITVNGRTSQTPLKQVDAANRTITITVETRQGKQDKTHPVAKDAKLTIDGKEVQLGDLKTGIPLLLIFSAEDGNTILQVRSPGKRRGTEEE